MPPWMALAAQPVAPDSLLTYLPSSVLGPGHLIGEVPLNNTKARQCAGFLISAWASSARSRKMIVWARALQVDVEGCWTRVRIPPAPPPAHLEVRFSHFYSSVLMMGLHWFRQRQEADTDDPTGDGRKPRKSKNCQ